MVHNMLFVLYHYRIWYCTRMIISKIGLVAGMHRIVNYYFHCYDYDYDFDDYHIEHS